MGTNLMRALLLTSASVAMVATAAPTVAYAQEATYQIDIPAQSMGDALRALGKATKQNIVFNGSLVKGKRSAAVRGRMSASEALNRMLQGSGLKMSRGAGGGLVVAQGGNENAGANSKAPANISDSATAPSALASTVVDARTGTPLKGALVEIIETGEKTSTGDVGEFRFPGKTGTYNLRISYLGYPEYQQFVDMKGGIANTGIFLPDGSAVSEIIVYGSRSARAQSLNQERTADNSSSVVSADDLGSFSGTTISDSLRRLPGVAFERNPTTGQGTNLIIRGLGPGLNEVKVNGIALPETTGQLRSADLGSVLTDSIEEITINKTLLPSQDAAGAGGLVEIRTKSPLSRPRRYANLSVEGGLKDGEFDKDVLISGTLSGKFGSDQSFGLSASVQYRKERTRRYIFQHGLEVGKYLPLEVDGTTGISFLSQIDPKRQFPFEPGADQTYVTSVSANDGVANTENYVFTISAEKRFGSGTRVALDFQRSVSDEGAFISRTTFTSSSYKVPTPIASLNGEIRQGVIWDGNAYGEQSYGYSPSTKNRTDILTLRGESVVDKLKLTYSAGYALGKQRVAGTTNIRFSNFSDTLIDPSLLLPGATDAVEGRVLTLFGERVGRSAQFPLLTADGFARVNNPASYSLSEGNITTPTQGKSSRLTAEVSARYDVSLPWIEYVEAGGNYKKSKFDNNPGNVDIYFGSPTVASLGLPMSYSQFGRIGFDRTLLSVPADAIKQFALDLPGLANQAGSEILVLSFPTDPRNEETSSSEKQLDAYIQGKFTFGRLDIVGGVRFDRTKFAGDVLYGAAYYDENFVPDPDFNIASRAVVRVKGTVTDWLPRISANWRLKDNLIFRFGYYSSVARPDLRDLGAGSFIQLIEAPFFGESGSQPTLEVRMGNPSLKPARTHSYDFSAELYSGDLGAIKVGAFYKEINNPLELNQEIGTSSLAGVDLPDDPRFDNLPNNIFVSVSRPANGTRSNSIWGIETSVERQLTFLPGVLGGLGVILNYTYTNGKTDAQFNWSAPIVDANGIVVGRENRVADITNVPLLGQSPHTGTAAVTYNKYGIDASLSYTYQSKRLLSFGRHGLHQRFGAYDSLDFRAEYRLADGRYRFFLEGNDLLKGAMDPDLLTYNGEIVQNGVYLGGREVRVGISASF